MKAFVGKCGQKISTLGCQIDKYTRLFGTKETWRKKQTQRQTKVFNKNPPYSFIWPYSFNWHLRVCINKFLVMFFPFELKGCTNGYIQLMRGETGFFQSSHSFEHHYILLELFLLRKKILKLLQHIVFQDFVAVGAMIVFLHNADWRCPQESVKSFLHSRLLF